jgi:hypothetical protein
VLNVEGSYGHVEHLLGGVTCLTGGITSNAEGKVEAVTGGGYTSPRKELTHC